jgi:hypothetical protein
MLTSDNKPVKLGPHTKLVSIKAATQKTATTHCQGTSMVTGTSQREMTAGSC